MAVTAATLQSVRRLRFVRKNAQGALVPLNFDLVTIDSQDQFYEPVSFGHLSPFNWKRQDGTVVGTQVLDANMPLPIAARGRDQDRTGVFFYGGL